jgi:hypothetical protein
LGDVCLPPAKRGFQMTDAGFAFSNCKKNGNPLWRGDRFKWCSNLFSKMGDSLLFQIHKPEYMATT